MTDTLVKWEQVRLNEPCDNAAREIRHCFSLSCCCVCVRDNTKLSVIQGKFSRCQACHSHPRFVFLPNLNFHNTTQADGDKAGSHNYAAFFFCLFVLCHTNVKIMFHYQHDIKRIFQSSIQKDNRRMRKQMLNQPS